MNRRSFLALLGLSPLAAMAAKAMASESQNEILHFTCNSSAVEEWEMTWEPLKATDTFILDIEVPPGLEYFADFSDIIKP